MIHALYAATVNEQGQLKLEPHMRAQMDRDLRLLKGKRIEIAIKESKPTRSSGQNRERDDMGWIGIRREHPSAW